MIDHWNSHETAAMGAAFEMVMGENDELWKDVAVRDGIANAILWAARNGIDDPNRLADCGRSAVPALMAKWKRNVVLSSRSPLTGGGGRASRPVSAPRRRADRMVAAE